MKTIDRSLRPVVPIKRAAVCVVPWIADPTNDPDDWSLRGMYCYACAVEEFKDMKAKNYKVGRPISISSAERTLCLGRSDGGKHHRICRSEYP